MVNIDVIQQLPQMDAAGNIGQNVPEENTLKGNMSTYSPRRVYKQYEPYSTWMFLRSLVYHKIAIYMFRKLRYWSKHAHNIAKIYVMLDNYYWSEVIHISLKFAMDETEYLCDFYINLHALHKHYSYTDRLAFYIHSSTRMKLTLMLYFSVINVILLQFHFNY